MRRYLKLLVVQKSETTTRDVQNHGKNGINYLHLNWFSRREFLVAINRMTQECLVIVFQHVSLKSKVLDARFLPGNITTVD